MRVYMMKVAYCGLLCVAISGCAAALEDPDRFRSTPLSETTDPSTSNQADSCDVPKKILQERCVSCHAGKSPAAKLDLSATDTNTLHAMILQHTSAACDGKNLVDDPNKPKETLLYKKLTNTPVCGASMPLGGATLTDPELACVATWIASMERVQP